MANIAIINFCNLKCEYCFADDMIHEKSKVISLEDYRKMLEFMSRTPENHIGIIGGEPTLHPQFEDILKETNKYCREVNTSATLFTNGIKLKPYIPLLGDRIELLVNCNSPKFVPSNLYSEMISTLDKFNELSMFDRRVNIGCNIYPSLDDYSYIWEIVDKYHIHHIRHSVVSPGGKFMHMRNDKESYYLSMKKKYIDFCKDAIKHKCELGLDCGRIPECYFTTEERAIADEATHGYHVDFCEPVIDITSDFKAVSCFGAYNAGSVDIRDFNTIMEVRRYLTANMSYPAAKANCTGRCTTCKKHDLMQCSGGCLGFSSICNPGGIKEYYNNSSEEDKKVVSIPKLVESEKEESKNEAIEENKASNLEVDTRVVINVMDYGEKVSIDLPSKDFERMKAAGTIEDYIQKYLADRRKVKTNEMLDEVSVKDEEPIERVEAEVVDKEEDDFHYTPGGNKEC